MNESKLQTARAYQDWMARAFLFYRIALVLLILGAVVILQTRTHGRLQTESLRTSIPNWPQYLPFLPA